MNMILGIEQPEYRKYYEMWDGDTTSFHIPAKYFRRVSARPRFCRKMLNMFISEVGPANIGEITIYPMPDDDEVELCESIKEHFGKHFKKSKGPVMIFSGRHSFSVIFQEYALENKLVDAVLAFDAHVDYHDIVTGDYRNDNVYGWAGLKRYMTKYYFSYPAYSKDQRMKWDIGTGKKEPKGMMTIDARHKQYAKNLNRRLVSLRKGTRVFLDIDVDFCAFIKKWQLGVDPEKFKDACEVLENKNFKYPFVCFSELEGHWVDRRNSLSYDYPHIIRPVLQRLLKLKMR